MVLKIFIDTNVFIDFIEQRPFEIEATNQLFLLAQKMEIAIYVSESVITTSYYISKQPVLIEKTLYLVKNICTPVSVMQSAFLSSFKDKEDAILYYGALHSKLDYFVTGNEKDFKSGALKQLPVVGVKQFLKVFNR